MAWDTKPALWKLSIKYAEVEERIHGFLTPRDQSCIIVTSLLFLPIVGLRMRANTLRARHRFPQLVSWAPMPPIVHHVS